MGSSFGQLKFHRLRLSVFQFFFLYTRSQIVSGSFPMVPAPPRLTPPTLLLKQITGKWVVLPRSVLSLKYGCVWSAGPRHSQRRGYMFRYEQDQSFCCRYHYQFVMSAKARLNSSAQDYYPQVIACFSVSLTAFSPKAPYAVWPEICWRGTMGFRCLALARFEVMN